MDSLPLSELKDFILSEHRIIDVRAPSEFHLGAIPKSINLPILDNDERHQVGLCYKEQGQEKAIELGHKLVSGENLSLKLMAWKTEISKDPKTVLTCFRGGLRSQSAQNFLSHEGLHVPRLKDGYKAARSLMLDFLNTEATKLPLVILSGTTGSGKTHLLNKLASFYPAIDLEGLAHHRGSAFGAWDIPQPSQADFENRLSVETMRLAAAKIQQATLLEDESRMIGTCHILEPFFLAMRNAPVILVQESLSTRIENIFSDYIATKLEPNATRPDVAEKLFLRYKTSVNKIQKKLGGLRAQELLIDLEECQTEYFELESISKNKVWIEKLLVWYYDPMYVGSLEKRAPKIQFQGSSEEITAYLRSLA